MSRKIVYILVLFAVLLPASSLMAQRERASVRQGNKYYHKENYVEAEIEYLKALSIDSGSVIPKFNLSDALYKQQRYDDARKYLQSVLKDTLGREYQAHSFYNMGNIDMQQKKYAEAVENYKNSLRIDPSDKDAKFNLAYAQLMLKNQQNNQDQNKDQNKDNKDQNKDQDKNKDNQDQNKDQNKDNQDQDKDQNQDNQDQQQNQDQKDNGQQQDNQMSQNEAEAMLQAIQNDENNTRQKVDAQKTKGVVVKSGKNW